MPPRRQFRLGQSQETEARREERRRRERQDRNNAQNERLHRIRNEVADMVQPMLHIPNHNPDGPQQRNPGHVVQDYAQLDGGEEQPLYFGPPERSPFDQAAWDRMMNEFYPEEANFPLQEINNPTPERIAAVQRFRNAVDRGDPRNWQEQERERDLRIERDMRREQIHAAQLAEIQGGAPAGFAAGFQPREQGEDINPRPGQRRRIQRGGVPLPIQMGPLPLWVEGPPAVRTFTAQLSRNLVKHADIPLVAAILQEDKSIDQEFVNETVKTKGTYAWYLDVPPLGTGTERRAGSCVRYTGIHLIHQWDAQPLPFSFCDNAHKAYLFWDLGSSEAGLIDIDFAQRAQIWEKGSYNGYNAHHLMPKREQQGRYKLLWQGPGVSFITSEGPVATGRIPANAVGKYEVRLELPEDCVQKIHTTTQARGRLIVCLNVGTNAPTAPSFDTTQHVLRARTWFVDLTDEGRDKRAGIMNATNAVVEQIDIES